MDLREFIKKNRVNAEIIEFKEPVMTVEQAARMAKCRRDEIIKSIVLIDSSNNPVIAIVDGESRVSLRKVGEISGKNVRIAKAREVERKTGYKIGGVPPIGHRFKTIIDKKIIDKKYVYGGGGDSRHLIKISPKEIVRLGAIIADISE